jgi:tripartite-type tricarboxylate transporter receptor subunit TctC
MTSWYALFVPAGTPAGIEDTLNKEVNAILEEKDTQEKLAGMVATPGGGTPEELRKHVASEIAKYGEVVKASGATAD